MSEASELGFGVSLVLSASESLEEPDEVLDSEPESNWLKVLVRFPPLLRLSGLLTLRFLTGFASALVAAMRRCRISSIFFSRFEPFKLFFTFPLNDRLPFFSMLSHSSLIKLKSTNAFFGIFKIFFLLELKIVWLHLTLTNICSSSQSCTARP